MSRVRGPGHGGRLLLAVAVAGAVFGIATAVQASIPDANGVIHGCYNSNRAHGTLGQLRVIDTSALGGACASWEAPLNWNAKGVSGATGATGPTGSTGPTGPSDTFYTTGCCAEPLSNTGYETILSLSLPAGSYLLNGSFQFGDNSFTAVVGCLVFLGANQTDPTFKGEIFNIPNSFLEIPVTSAFTLAATTTVSVQCSSSVNLGAVPQPSSLAATRVGSLTKS